MTCIILRVKPYVLPVELRNDCIGAILALEHDFGDGDWMRLYEATAGDQAANRSHSTLYVSGSRATGEVLSQNNVRTG